MSGRALSMEQQRFYTIATRAATVPGWMTEDELAWLAEQASTRRSIVEFGCWQGRSTVALALATPGQVSAVDNWYGEDNEPGMRGEALRYAFWDNLKAHGVRNVDTYSMTSAEFATACAKSSFDMLFIDADHRPAAVAHDCRVALALAADGALICGHDWYHPGVADAVQSVFPSAAPVRYLASIWAVQPVG